MLQPFKNDLDEAQFDKEHSGGHCGTSFVLNTPQSSPSLSAALPPTAPQSKRVRDTLKK